MKHLTALIIFVLPILGNFCFSQDITSSRDSITIINLQQHIKNLCVEQNGGRKFATQGEKDAANYIRDQFNRSGLSSKAGFENHFQDYTLSYDTLMSFSIENQNLSLDYISDFITWEFCFLANSIQEDMVYAGFGLDTDDYSDYSQIDVEDKWVVVEVNSPLDSNGNLLAYFDFAKAMDYSQFSIKKEIAKKSGAKGIIFKINSDEYVDFLGNNMNVWYHFRSKEMTALNNLIGTYPAIFARQSSLDSLLGVNTEKFNDEINNRLKDGVSPAGIVEASVSFKIQKEQRHFHSQNVIGIINGKEETVGTIVTAHYDAVKLNDTLYYPGANDNASGTAALIEISNAISRLTETGYLPERSIAFVAFSGEEEGLIGSDYFVKHLPFEIDSNLININMDGIGFLNPERIEKDSFTYFLASEEELARMKPEVAELISRSEPPFSVIFLEDPFSSDHYSFFKEGYRAYCFMTGGAKNHTTEDNPETINYQNFASVTRFIFDFIIYKDN